MHILYTKMYILPTTQSTHTGVQEIFTHILVQNVNHLDIAKLIPIENLLFLSDIFFFFTYLFDKDILVRMKNPKRLN